MAHRPVGDPLNRRETIVALVALGVAPLTAEAQQVDGSWRSLPTKDISVGTVVRIKPGERVALDGVVTAGNSAIDQAPVTGESIPVDKTLGDSVFAGNACNGSY